MNAPTAASNLAPAAEILTVSIDRIAPSRSHIQSLRRARLNPQALAELAETIKKVGVIQSISVRPWKAPAGLNKVDSDPDYEIIAGERRWKAAKLAGLTELEVKVHEIDDEAALEIQLIENLHRDELHELEEAEGYKELMRITKIEPEAIGTKIGRSRSYVYARLKLLQLLPEARDAFSQGKIDASRALEISRIPDPERQAEALRLASELDHNGKFQRSVRMLREALGTGGHVVYLVHAPFPITDPTLVPAAGACTDCLHRSGNAVTDDNAGDDPNVCTKVSCYHGKVQAETDRRRATLKAKGQLPIKGEAERKIARGSKGDYVGYVDLDLPCTYVEFEEKEPEYNEELWDEDPAYLAWELRERAFKPPTWRALFKDVTPPLATVFLDDHRTKRCHELVAVKDIRPVLKKLKIDVPANLGADHYAHRSTPSKAAPAPKNEAPDAKAKRLEKEAAAKAEAELQAKIAEEFDKRYPAMLFAEARKKYPKALGRTELQHLAASMLNGLEDTRQLCAIYGWKERGWVQPEEWVKRVSSFTEAQLVPLLLDCLLQERADGDYTGGHDGLESAVRAHKIPADTIRKSLEAEIRAKFVHPVAVKPAMPAAKAAPAKKAAAKKKPAAKAKGKKK